MQFDFLKLGTGICGRFAGRRLAEGSRKAVCNFEAHGPREALQLRRAASRKRQQLILILKYLTSR